MTPWYLLFCKRSEQTRAVINLERQGVQCYAPQLIVEKFVKGVYKKQLESLFPSYLFVSFDPEKISYTTVRSTRGVLRFIMSGNMPQVVPKELIEHLRDREEKNPPSLSLLPQKGESLQLVKGQFKGVPAIYLEPDGETRSFILLTILNKETRISVENNALQS